jgi:hypothetical protein
VCYYSIKQTPWILALIFSYCDMSDDTRWRLLLGLGAVPSAFVVCCSILESRAAASQSKLDDSTHALLSNPTHADQFHHHADGGISHSSHGSSHSSGSSPFHDHFGGAPKTVHQVPDCSEPIARIRS